MTISRAKLVQFLQDNHAIKKGPILLTKKVFELLGKDVHENELLRKINSFLKLFNDRLYKCGSNFDHLRQKHESWINGPISFERSSTGKVAPEVESFPGIMSPKEAIAAGITPTNLKLHFEVIKEDKQKHIKRSMLTKEDFGKFLINKYNKLISISVYE